MAHTEVQKREAQTVLLIIHCLSQVQVTGDDRRQICAFPTFTLDTNSQLLSAGPWSTLLPSVSVNRGLRPAITGQKSRAVIYIERANMRITTPIPALPETGDPGREAVASSTLLQGGGTADLETTHNAVPLG
jgi:hypothetical protein